MTAPALRIEAPSDAQLRYIRGLCEEHGVEFPEAVFSKGEASEIIAAGTPADPLYVDDDPRDDFEQERDAFADGRSAYDPRVRP